MPILGYLCLPSAEESIQQRTMNIDKLSNSNVLYIKCFPRKLSVYDAVKILHFLKATA